tara:strand:+ start:67 stop:801 length:735 start_codon:yes stop_codon:yes gene_type:complete
MIKSLSIIFPIFNEEPRLKSSFRHILAFLKMKKSFKIEMIFVDDGSNDNSYKMINNFSKDSKIIKNKNNVKIRIIKSKKNQGKGSALKIGVKQASYDWVLTTDIDMSVPLFQINNWINKKFIQKKYHAFIGSRSHLKSIVEKKFYRQVLGNIMSFLIFIILNIKIRDTQCGFKLYNKKIAKFLFSNLKSNGFDHDLELILLLKKKNFLVKELPVKWKHVDNSRLNIFWDPIKMFFGILFMKLRV